MSGFWKARRHFYCAGAARIMWSDLPKVTRNLLRGYEMSEDPIVAIRQVVECIDEGCVPGSGHVTSGWLRRASKDEILDWVWGNLRGRVINALERTRDAISTLNSGNAASMRDALVELMQFTCNSCQERFCESDCEEEDGQCVPVPCSAILKARAALAEPARN